MLKNIAVGILLLSSCHQSSGLYIFWNLGDDMTEGAVQYHVAEEAEESPDTATEILWNEDDNPRNMIEIHESQIPAQGWLVLEGYALNDDSVVMPCTDVGTTNLIVKYDDQEADVEENESSIEMVKEGTMIDGQMYGSIRTVAHCYLLFRYGK